MPGWWVEVRTFLERLWVRTAAFCLLAVMAAVVALPFEGSLSDTWLRYARDEALNDLLAILSSSMLVIATFSLGTMASAFATASQTATPRAEPLLLGDSGSQTAVATFVGTFLYAVVAQLGLGLGLYGEVGRLVLFGVTLTLLVVIVATLVRWVDEVARLGRVHHTVDRLGDAAKRAARAMGADPHRGGYPFDELPDGFDVCARQVGCVRYIDPNAFGEVVEEHPGMRIYLRVRAGSFCHPGRPLLRVVGVPVEEARRCADRLRQGVHLGHRRSLRDDAEFGLIALSEVASRALSPGVNDPGTAIDVLAALAEVLYAWAEGDRERVVEDVPRPWLFVPSPDVAGALERAMLPVLRDGAGQLEVQEQAQRSLAAIAACHPLLEEPSFMLARRACDLAGPALPDDGSRESLRRRHQDLFRKRHEMMHRKLVSQLN
jgi:uncharacterized membrane protein